MLVYSMNLKNWKSIYE